MKINTKKAEAQWFDYDETVKFKVRRLPMSLIKLDGGDAMTNSLYEFDYCLVDWAGISNDDGGTFECNEENKKYLFDYYGELAAFIKNKALELTIGINEDLKN